jgi:hypothetical protein
MPTAGAMRGKQRFTLAYSCYLAKWSPKYIGIDEIELGSAVLTHEPEDQQRIPSQGTLSRYMGHYKTKTWIRTT